MKYLTRLLLLFFLSSTVCVCQASDLAKEKRWAEQIVDAIFDGEPVTLNDKKLEFLAIYTPSTTVNSADAAILLHGIGAHPDWDQVIRPLRTSLPELGWSTLSLQMPILVNEASGKDYAPLFKEVAGRVDAGIEYLKEKGATRIVIISHSLGAAMGSYYLANHQSEQISGFVGIGMSGEGKIADMDNVVQLKSIQLPILDLYGEHDLESVLASASARKKSSTNQKSVQKMVTGADHFFDGQNEVLIDEVSGWLKGLK